MHRISPLCHIILPSTIAAADICTASRDKRVANAFLLISGGAAVSVPREVWIVGCQFEMESDEATAFELVLEILTIFAQLFGVEILAADIVGVVDGMPRHVAAVGHWWWRRRRRWGWGRESVVRLVLWFIRRIGSVGAVLNLEDTLFRVVGRGFLQG